MKTRRRFVLLLSLLSPSATHLGTLIISSLPWIAHANSSTAEPPLSLKDWTAAGSGCRSQMNKPGDVELQSVRINSNSGNQLVVVKFRLPKYKLHSPPENPSTSLTFARECALRIAAKPIGPMRIKSIAARTPVIYSKDADVGLKLQYLLRLDGEIVAQALKEIEAGKAIHHMEEVIVVNGKPSDESLEMRKMNPTSCGSAQMIGFDYTFIAARKNRPDRASVQLSEDKQLEFALELERCT
jgi:hypothetical protein